MINLEFISILGILIWQHPKTNNLAMTIADILVDAATGHEILFFMDGHAGYN